MAKKHLTPHDHLFKATFSHRQEVIRFIKKFFPERVYNKLDFRTLKIQNTSFVNDKLEDHYSDITYTCKWKGNNKEALLSFLFEHKSYYVEYPEFQLMRYMIEGYEYQLKQGKEYSLIIPVLIYHGKRKLKTTNFLEDLKLPDSFFAKYFPRFEFIKIDLDKYSDDEIISIGATFLTSMLLLFKHKREKKFILKHYREIFIFVESYGDKDKTERFVETLILYIYQSFTIKGKEFKEIFEDLPKNLSDMFVSTWDMNIEKGKIQGMKIGRKEGMEKGIEKGMEKGIERGKIYYSLEVAFTSFATNGDLSNDLIAKLTTLPPSTIRSLRRAYKTTNRQSARKILNKILKADAPISDLDKKQIEEILDKFFKK